MAMSQPELGKRLAEIRKQRGMTQEDLVAKCNVNVRTVQRIEAGEVVPRTSTLRLLVEALEYDWNAFTQQLHGSGHELKSTDNSWTNIIFLTNASELGQRSTQNQLQLAWVAGIFYFILGFPESVLELAVIGASYVNLDATGYIVVKVLVAISFLFFIRGFIIIGHRHRKPILTLSAYIYALVLLLDYSVDIYLYATSAEINEARLVSKGIMYGFVVIVFGIGLLRLEDVAGRPAIIAGFLEIIIGILFLTVILFMGGLALLTLAEILEIYILYKYAENLKKLEHRPG